MAARTSELVLAEDVFPCQEQGVRHRAPVPPHVSRLNGSHEVHARLPMRQLSAQDAERNVLTWG